MICPNKATKEWRDLMGRVGDETLAYYIWNKTEGTLSNEKIDNAIKSMSMRTQQPINVVIDNLRKGMVNNTLDHIVTRMKKVLPKMDVRVVTDKDTTNDTDPAYINNGKIFLNSDRIRPDSKMHEIAHVFLDLLQKENPNAYGRLYNEAVQMSNSKEIVQHIRDKQPNLTPTDIVKETLATILGFNNEESVIDHYTRNHLGNETLATNFWGRVKDTISELWNNVKGYFEKNFGLHSSVLSTTDFQNVSIAGLSSILKDAYDNGKVLSYVSSDEYETMDNTKNWRSTEGTPNHYSSIKDLDRLSSIDFDERERRKGLKDYQSVKDEDRVAEGMAKIMTEGNIKILSKTDIGGKQIFSQLEPQDYQKLMMNTYHAKGVEHLPMQTFIEKYKLSPAFVNTYGLKSAVISIEINNPKDLQVSIYNFINEPLTKAKVRYGNKNILSKMGVTDIQAKAQGIERTATNDPGSISDMKLTLLANALMKEYPNIHVNDMKTISVSRGINARIVDHPAWNRTLMAMSKIKEFTSNLENSTSSMIKSFTDPEYTKQESSCDYFELLKGLTKSWDDSSKSAVLDVNKYGTLYGDASNLINTEQKLNLINDRLRELNAIPDNDPEVSYERNLLLGLSKELRRCGLKINYNQINSSTDLSKIQKLMSDTMSIGNEIVQDMNLLVDQNDKLIFKTFKEAMGDFYGSKGKEDGIVDYFRKKSGNIIINKDTKVFDELYHKIKIDGKDVRSGLFYYTNKVTEDMTPTEKILAEDAARNRVSKEVLEQGMRLKSLIDDQIIDRYIHNENMRVGEITDDGTYKGHYISKEDAADPKKRAEILAIVKKFRDYSSGMLPIAIANPRENVSKFHMWDYAKRTFNVATNMFTTFGDIGDSGVHSADGHLIDRYSYQFLSSEQNSNNLLGNDERLKLMGLQRETDGHGKEFYTYLKDNEKNIGQKINNELSTDLTYMLNNFVLNNVRNRLFEENVLPITNGLKIGLEEKQKYSGMPTEEMRSYVDMYTQQAIEGRGMGLSFHDKDYPGIDKGVMAAMRLGRGMFMPFNINVAVLKTTTDIARSFIEANAHTMTGAILKMLPKYFEGAEQHYFGTGDLIKAAATVLNPMGFNKATQIAFHYNLVRSELRDLLQDRLHTGQKYALDSYWGRWMMQGSDMIARTIIMTAQMIKDGTYDAHIYNPETGKITIDISKDKRIYVNKGKYTETGKAREQYLMESLKLEGRTDRDANTPTHLYNTMEQKIFNFLGNKYITAAYSEKLKPLMGSIFLGKMFSMFHQYFLQIANNAFEPYQNLDAGGWTKFTKDKDGEFVPEWARAAVEGYCRNMFRRVKELATIRDLSKMKKLQPHEIYNMCKIASLVATFCALRLLYGSMVKEQGNKDKEGNVIPEWRVVRSFKYSYNSLFVMSMAAEVAKSPFAFIGTLTGTFMNPYGAFRLGGSYVGKPIVELGKDIVSGKTASDRSKEDQAENRKENETNQ